MTSSRIITVRSGLASLEIAGKEVATLERYEARLTEWYGDGWFAYQSPSHADALANQEDRIQYAKSSGRTRRECAESFVYLAAAVAVSAAAARVARARAELDAAEAALYAASADAVAAGHTIVHVAGLAGVTRQTMHKKLGRLTGGER